MSILERFDVFLSHNSIDKPIVRQLGEALKAQDLTVWLDEWELRPGKRWQDALEDIINTCKSAAVCVGSNGIGPWEDPEMNGLLRRFVEEKKAGNELLIIPVLLPGAPDDVKLPLFLNAFMWVDLRHGLTKKGLGELVWGITGVKPNSGRPHGSSSDSGVLPAERRSVDFVLHIGRGNGRKYPVAVIETSSVTAQETMNFPFDEIVLENHLLRLSKAILESATLRRDVQSQGKKDVCQFGSQLFDALIAGAVRERYDAARSEASRQGVECRILLHIEEAAELAGLPWEFIFDSREDQFPCLSRNTPIVRHLSVSRVRPSSVLRTPLRVLAMLSNPESLSPIDGEREIGRMQRALAPLGHRVEVEWLEAGTCEALQRKLREGPWHVFHFSGHGRFDEPSSEGEILLEDGQRRPHSLKATQLCDLLCDHSSLALVVLNSCDTAVACKNDIFSSTAAKLVRRGIPAVLAMQYEISDRAAIAFSQAFYESLTAGLEVGDAVTEARKAVASSKHNSVEWGTPVLFAYSANSIPLHLIDESADPKVEVELHSDKDKDEEVEVKGGADPCTGRNQGLTDRVPGTPRESHKPRIKADKTYWRATQLPVVVIVACSGSSIRQGLNQAHPFLERPLPVFFTCAHLDAFATNQQFAFEWCPVNTSRLLAEIESHLDDRRLFVIVSDQLVTVGSDGQFSPSQVVAEIRKLFLEHTQQFCGLVGLVNGPARRTPDVDRVVDAGSMDGESLRNEITKVADGLRLKAPPGPPRALPRERAIEVKVAQTREELYDCLALRFQVYDRMGYLEDRISQCPSQLEVDRYDVYDRKGAIHFIAKDHDSGEIAGTVRLVLARGLGNIRESVIGSHPQQTLLKQSNLIREIAKCEADKAAANPREANRAILEQKINAPGYFGSLPILQSADFHEKSRAILKRAEDIGELSRLVVGPRYRGLGVSKVLVRAVLATAFDLKKDVVLLECVPSHVSMYEDFGFRQIEGSHSRAQELDQEAVAMMLELKTPLQRFVAVANKDLAMIKEGSGPPDPGMLFGSKHLCLCSNIGCWSNGAYSERTRSGCPLRDLHRSPR